MKERKTLALFLMIAVLAVIIAVDELRTRVYTVPAVIATVFIFFQRYPNFAQRMHRRKLTYEDLEDIHDADPSLRKRFQIVFTRVQQLGGSLCAGVLVLYAFHVVDSEQTIFETLGVLGGILSLYARIFGYIGNFCIECLHNLKRKHQYESDHADGDEHPPEHGPPHSAKP